MAKINLQEAFWHVPICPSFRRFLTFDWKDRSWCFAVMLFGLAIAPVAFANLMNFPKKLLEAQGHKIVIYLDDWLVWAPTQEQCSKTIKALTNLLQSLGFLIHWSKSITTPSQSLVWLGVEWRSSQETLSLPLERAEELSAKIMIFCKKDSTTRREVESILGSMNFVAGWLPKVKLEKNLIVPFLRQLPNCRTMKNDIPNSVRENLSW